MLFLLCTKQSRNWIGNSYLAQDNGGIVSAQKKEERFLHDKVVAAYFCDGISLLHS